MSKNIIVIVVRYNTIFTSIIYQYLYYSYSISYEHDTYHFHIISSFHTLYSMSHIYHPHAHHTHTQQQQQTVRTYHTHTRTRTTTPPMRQTTTTAHTNTQHNTNTLPHTNTRTCMYILPTTAPIMAPFFSFLYVHFHWNRSVRATQPFLPPPYRLIRGVYPRSLSHTHSISLSLKHTHTLSLSLKHMYTGRRTPYLRIQASRFLHFNSELSLCIPY